MKKISIIMAMAALALGFTSCKQNDEPKYQNPTTFTVNTPALQDQAFRTSGDMTDPATINLFCSQPDYGYAAICNYSALISLDENAPIEEWKEVVNETPTQAAMALKTFNVGAAINQLLEVTDEEEFNNRNLGDTPLKVYFKAVCEIPGIEGSKIISSNTVSYNKVYINYAVPKPGWIYIAGNVQNPENGLVEGFKGPSVANQDHMDNFRLFEPEDMIGQKLYVGVFNIVPKTLGDVGDDPDAFNEENPDANAQFRFFTELLGWVDTASLGSHSDDFYCLKTTPQWAAGFEGSIVAKGLGNWGIFLPLDAEPVATTFVVDVTGLQIYYMEGVHDVEFTGRVPTFN